MKRRVGGGGAAIASAGLAREEWWQTPTADLLPLLRKANGVVVELLDAFGVVGCMRFNMLHPPFDNWLPRLQYYPCIRSQQSPCSAGARTGASLAII
jgi:peptide/nickel transport system substrate-binding protein